MLTTKSKQTLRSLCPEVRVEFFEEFLERMDEEYFADFPLEVVVSHIRMAANLQPGRRAHVQIMPQTAGEFDITIVGYDYPSSFSILCGLLSAFGLDIRKGDIYSFSKKTAASPGRLVDVFEVALRQGESFDEPRQQEFQRELQGLAELLGDGDISEARERLNRFLIEHIEQMGEAFAGLGSPINITFDNQVSPLWTLLEVRSEDTFGFLYAISNALAMRGIYTNKARIRSSDGKAVDRFFVANRWGRKIESTREQQRLTFSVSMIEAFTRFLPDAPDTGRALRHFDQFLDKLIELSDDSYPDRFIEFLAGDKGMSMLAQLLGSSDFLWDDLLRVHFSALMPAMEDFASWELRSGPEFRRALKTALREQLEQSDSADLVEKKRILNGFKDREVFLIDAAHLIQPRETLLEFSYALTDLGEVVIQEASRVCFEHLLAKQLFAESNALKPSFAIFGLGKFGGREMGYASDLELLFVHEAAEHSPFFEAFARLVVDFIEARSHGIFHIDLRLRPYGEAGPWSVPFETFAKYYSPAGDAAPFERQALIKMRWIAGDEDLGRRVHAHRDTFIYSGLPWDWADAMQLRRRQMLELVRPGQTNAKYSAGGIIDIEYAVQYLQLLNGAEHPEVRLSATLDTLHVLRRLQIVREADFSTLHRGYLFLRDLIDGLRIVRGDATDLVLPDERSEEFKALARRLGYRERDRLEGAAHLAADIRESMSRIHDYFMLRFQFDI